MGENNIHITKREIQILQLIAQEKSSVEIGELLNISKRTVESHKNNIANKLNIKKSIGFVKQAIKLNLLSNYKYIKNN